MSSSTISFHVSGMDCAEEVALLKRELVPLVGNEKLMFDVLNAKLGVDLTGTEINAADVVAAVARTGMQAKILEPPK